MKRLLTAALIALLPALAHAVGSGCQATTGPLTLEKVRSSATGSEIYGCINRTFDTLSSLSASTSSVSVATFGVVNVSTINAISGRTVGNGPNYGVYLSTNFVVAGQGLFKYTGGYSVNATSGIFSSQGIVGSWFNGTHYGTWAGQPVSTVAASGVGAYQTCGDASNVCRQDVTPDGRIVRTSTASISITNSNLQSGAYSNVTGVGTQSQALDMNSHKINNLTDPTSAQDAVTLAYLNANLSSATWKVACYLATTAALPSNSYSNGSSGVGATLTGLALGTLSVDGTAVPVGARVLVKNESDHSHDGIYLMTTNAAGVFYILTRATDYDTAVEMEDGTAVGVDGGATLAGNLYQQQAVITTVGTDALTFTQIGGPVLAGTGLSKSGNTLSVAAPTARSDQDNAWSAAQTHNSSDTWKGVNLKQSSGTLLLDGNKATPLQISVSSFVATSVGSEFRIGVGTATPTDAVSVVGSVNVTTGLKYNTVAGTDGALTGGQTMCGGTWFNGIYVGGTACTAGGTVPTLIKSSVTIAQGTSIANNAGGDFASCAATITVQGTCSGTNLWIGGTGSLRPDCDYSSDVQTYVLMNGAFLKNYSSGARTGSILQTSGMNAGPYGQGASFGPLIQTITAGTSPTVCIGWEAHNACSQQLLTQYTLSAWCY